MGIGPTQPAWKAGILPLNYTRNSQCQMIIAKRRAYCQIIFVPKIPFFQDFSRYGLLHCRGGACRVFARKKSAGAARKKRRKKRRSTPRKGVRGFAGRCLHALLPPKPYWCVKTGSAGQFGHGGALRVLRGGLCFAGRFFAYFAPIRPNSAKFPQRQGGIMAPNLSAAEDPLRHGGGAHDGLSRSSHPR